MHKSLSELPPAPASIGLIDIARLQARMLWHCSLAQHVISLLVWAALDLAATFAMMHYEDIGQLGLRQWNSSGNI